MVYYWIKMFRSIIRPYGHGIRPWKSVKSISRVGGIRYSSKWQNEGKTDDKIQFKWFLLVGVFGTMVYITVMQRIKEQDHSKNLEKYKKTFSEDEWNQYISEIQKKQLTLENNEECYLIPFANKEGKNNKKINQLNDKLGGDEYVSVLDLNQLVNEQINNSGKYNILLNQTLESIDENNDGFKYNFSYKLKPGIFTSIINDEILKIKEINPKMGRFIILNYPPNIKEAIKFEQNISNKDMLIKLNNNNNKNDDDIIQYFETVDKVIDINKISKLEPLIIENIPTNKQIENKEYTTPAVFKLHTLSNEEPSNDAPVIEKAQYKLRQLNQPIRYYGETDEDVITRLNKLSKN